MSAAIKATFAAQQVLVRWNQFLSSCTHRCRLDEELGRGHAADLDVMVPLL